MAIVDYFKGPEHKAEATQLQTDLQALQARYMELETKAKETGALDLIEVKALIHNDQDRLADLHAQINASKRSWNARSGKQERRLTRSAGTSQAQFRNGNSASPLQVISRSAKIFRSVSTKSRAKIINLMKRKGNSTTANKMPALVMFMSFRKLEHLVRVSTRSV